MERAVATTPAMSFGLSGTMIMFEFWDIVDKLDTYLGEGTQMVRASVTTSSSWPASANNASSQRRATATLYVLGHW